MPEKELFEEVFSSEKEAVKEFKRQKRKIKKGFHIQLIKEYPSGMHKVRKLKMVS